MEEDKTKKGFKEKVVGIIRKNWIIILILLLLFSWFYWSQWRPVEIRRKCFEETAKFTKEGKDVLTEESLIFYQVCLTRHGMKSEAMSK